MPDKNLLIGLKTTIGDLKARVIADLEELKKLDEVLERDRFIEAIRFGVIAKNNMLMTMEGRRDDILSLLALYLEVFKDDRRLTTVVEIILAECSECSEFIHQKLLYIKQDTQATLGRVDDLLRKRFSEEQ